MKDEDSIGGRMDADRAAPGEVVGTGAPTTPRQAASVIVLRGGAGALELLLVRRNPAARFMGGAWVFPGGAVDADEGEGDPAHRAAAVREVREETRLEPPDAAALVKFSRWITPPELRIRFDTHFFLAVIPDGQEPSVDGAEMVDLGWHTPAGALAAHARGELELVFPTIKQLEQLDGFRSADAVLSWATGREVVAVEPRVRITGETARIVLPGEPGYV
jgi:8-oxo-dGTP pyrophosphatase MutT (NUDIX family)